jgi:hypothetical protein
MTIATDQRVQLSASLQSLIDSRLDTIDRMLLPRVARAERMAIVREVESQIHELLGERERDELSREDVLAVLGRLDPPEAFLPEEVEGDAPTAVRRPVGISQPAMSSPQRDQRLARASGILGLTALASLLFLPLSYALAMAVGSELLLILGAAGMCLCVFTLSALGIATGVYSRKGGAWAVVGIVTSVLALLFCLMIGLGFIGLILLS